VVAFNNKGVKLQKRRAISTIVGGAIFLVLLTSGFSTFFVAMDFQQDTINTQRTISNSIMEKTKEQFSISVSTDDSQLNLLGIQVKNQGTNPVEIQNIWIINNSGTYPAKKHLINYTDSIIPPGYGSDILANTPLHLTVVDDYDIKVVSTLGTIKKAKYTLGAGNNMRAELIAIPPDVKVGQNVTLMMHVENIGNSRLLNVHPFNDYPNINLPFDPPNPPIPSSYTLDPGEGAFYTWEYVTTGTSGNTIIFDSYATATEEDTGFIMNSNVAVEKMELQQPDDTEIIVLNQDLLSKPEIFMVIPGPFGHSWTEQALWGVNVVNPTAQIMNISKITISVLNPSDTATDEFFDQGNCNSILVPPASPGQWDCNLDNQMTWEPQGALVQVPPLSVKSFLTFASPGFLQSGKDLHTALVQTHVFTSSGEFGKGSYGSSMKQSGSALVNVFLSDVYPGTLNNDDIISMITNIPPGTSVAFNVTLAEFETTTGAKIESLNPDKTKLIINIPKGWTNVVVKESPGYDYVKYSQFSDGSSQLVGILSTELISGTETIKFRATAPNVSNTQMFVMYILADGVTDSGWTLGPLGEIVLQVVP